MIQGTYKGCEGKPVEFDKFGTIGRSINDDRVAILKKKFTCRFPILDLPRRTMEIKISIPGSIHTGRILTNDGSIEFVVRRGLRRIARTDRSNMDSKHGNHNEKSLRVICVWLSREPCARVDVTCGCVVYVCVFFIIL